MVYVSQTCADHVFYSNYPFVWPASLFLILGVFIPHIWAIDFNTPDRKQDIERSISYTWTFHSSQILLVILAIYNTTISAIGCYGAANQHPTPALIVIISWLLVAIAKINNTDFADHEKNYEFQNLPYIYNDSKRKFELMRAKDRNNRRLLENSRIVYKNTKVLKTKTPRQKTVSMVHKTLAGLTFAAIIVISVFLIIGENEYNKPGNDQTLVLCIFVTGCVSCAAMALHIIVRSEVCVRLGDKYFPSYAWNGVVSFFERMFTMCFLLIVMGTPREP